MGPTGVSRAEGLKAEGNSLYSQRAYEGCIEAYTQALDVLQDIETWLRDGQRVLSVDGKVIEDEWGASGEAALRLLVQVYANRSLGYLRLGDFQRAAEDGWRGVGIGRVLMRVSGVDEAIVEKAAYRRGVALCMLGEVEGCREACADVSVGGELGASLQVVMAQCEVVEAWGEGAWRVGVSPGVSRLVAMLWKDVLGDDDDGECDGIECDGTECGIECGNAGDRTGYPGEYRGQDGGQAEELSPNEMLERLIELVCVPGEGCLSNQLYVLSNSRLLLYLMNAPSTRPTVCGLLRAMVDVAGVWPRELWGFVVANACGKKAVGSSREDVEGYAGDCMDLLEAVVRGNAWVRQWVLTSRSWRDGDALSGAVDVFQEEGTSILEMVSKTVGTCHLSTRCVGKDAVAAGCGVLAAYASSDEASVTQLVSLGEARVVIRMLSAFENAKEIVWGSEEDAGEGGAGDASARVDGDDRGDEGTEEDENERAKRELIKKQRDVFDPVTIDLRKAILGHLKTVFACKQLVMSELVEWKGGRKCASQVHHRLVALGNMLVAKCPKRSNKVYDGLLEIASYEKKPYAADYNDNPAGDYLATIDLEGLASAAGRDLSASPVLEVFLEAMIVLLDHDSSFITGLLFKAGVLSLCHALSVFTTARTVELAQVICARVVDAVKEGREELLKSSNVILLAGLLLKNPRVARAGDVTVPATSNTSNELDAFALGELACAVPSCNGNELKYLIDKNSGFLSFLHDALVRGGMDKGHGRFADTTNVSRVTAELARRTMACGSHRVLRTGKKIPKGHGWGCFDTELLENVLYPIREGDSKTVDAHVNELGAGFARGFFPKVGGNPPKTLDTVGCDASINHVVDNEDKEASTVSATSISAPLPPSINQLTPEAKEAPPSSARCEIVELQGNDADTLSEHNPESQLESRPEATAAAPDPASGESDCELEVFEVYDSTPAEHIREARASWMAMDQSEKITWEQTSTDVVAKVKVPRGTSANDVSLTCTSTSLTINLKWYGKVLDGNLYGRIKAHEFTWCLNDDSEVYIVLPKDSKEHWWKTLIEGWEEKGYYELLKDAVDADEPHVAYDDMDESAKDLLDSMLERQAYINAGMLDLENGFDDFRIVLSDSSLKETSSS